jgi:hypothetical protein
LLAAGAGDVVPGRASVEVIGDFGFVLVPTGRLDLVLGEGGVPVGLIGGAPQPAELALVVDGTSYDVESLEPTVTVNGSEPLPPDGRFGRVDDAPSRVSGMWAFEASAEGPDRMSITLDLVLDKADAEAPGPGVRELTLEQTVELPAGQLAAGG